MTFKDDNISQFLWENDRGGIQFSHIEFKYFLERNGYYKYPLSTGYVLVHENDGIIEIVEDHQLKESLINLIDDRKRQNYLIEETSKIITKGKQDYLRTFNREFNEDTKDEHYAYFENGYYIVNKEKVTGPHPFSDLKKVIWKSKIIQKELVLNQDMEYLKSSEFYQLLWRITNKKEERLESLISSLGYLCYSFFDPSERKAIVTYDETDPDMEGVAEGGKGKSIIGQGLRHYKPNNTWIDGSRLEKIDKHTFQSVSPDTEIIIIDDLVKKFDFGKLFASVTEGVTVERKYQQPFVISNVKFFITSNFTLGGEGSSFERRLNEIEIAPYYNHFFTPKIEFGHLLFEEWDNEQWNMFYNLILFCVKTYLEKGLVQYSKINLSAKKVIENTSHEFYEFSKRLQENVIYEKDVLYYQFRAESSDHDASKHILTKYLKTFAKLNNLEYVHMPGTGNKRNSFKLVKYVPRLKRPEDVNKG